MPYGLQRLHITITVMKIETVRIFMWFIRSGEKMSKKISFEM